MANIFITSSGEQTGASRQSIVMPGGHNSSQHQQPSTIVESQVHEESPYQVIRNLQRVIKKQRKFINPQSPRTSQAMCNKKIMRSDIELPDMNEFSKALEYQVNREHYKLAQSGQQIDNDINLEKVIIVNYTDHLLQIKANLEQIIRERRFIINSENDELFQKTYRGEDQSKFFDRRQVKSQMGSRSLYGVSTYEERRDKLDTRQQRIREVKQREIDQQVEREILIQQKIENDQKRKDELDQKIQTIRNKNHKEISKKMKQLDKKIQKIREDKQEKQDIAFEKAQQFMNNINEKYDLMMKKRDEERYALKQQFLSDDRSAEIQKNISFAKSKLEMDRVELQFKINHDQECVEERRDEYLRLVIDEHQRNNLEKQQQIDSCQQLYKDQQQQKLEKYLKSQEQKEQYWAKIKKDKEADVKKKQKETQRTLTRFQNNMDRHNDQLNKRREKMFERSQMRHAQFDKNRETQDFAKFHRSELNLQRKTTQEQIFTDHQQKQEKKIQDILEKQQRAARNVEALKMEKLQLRQMSLENGLMQNREYNLINSKVNVLAKSIQSGKQKPIIKNLKDIGYLTHKDQDQYKQFFPKKKKKSEDEEEQLNQVKY